MGRNEFERAQNIEPDGKSTVSVGVSSIPILSANDQAALKLPPQLIHGRTGSQC